MQVSKGEDLMSNESVNQFKSLIQNNNTNIEDVLNKKYINYNSKFEQKSKNYENANDNINLNNDKNANNKNINKLEQ